LKNLLLFAFRFFSTLTEAIVNFTVYSYPEIRKSDQLSYCIKEILLSRFRFELLPLQSF